MEGLVKWFRLDAAYDIARVLRVPGFRNHKRDAIVTIPAENRLVIDAQKGEYLTFSLRPITKEDADEMYNRWYGEERYFLQAGDFLRDLYERVAGEGEYPSQSEIDWAFTRRALSLGVPEEVVKGFLEDVRQDKPKPTYYASLTVRKAEQSLNSPPPG